MKTVLIALAAATAVVAPSFAQSAAQPSTRPGLRPSPAAVVLTFQGLEPRGAVMAAVFDSEAAYAGRGAPVRAVRLEVSGTAASTRLTGLAPGRYAVKAFHDLDGDGDMDVNPFGLPTEPYAFSNNAQPHMGPPAFAAAAFAVGPGETAQVIALR